MKVSSSDPQKNRAVAEAKPATAPAAASPAPSTSARSGAAATPADRMTSVASKPAQAAPSAADVQANLIQARAARAEARMKTSDPALTRPLGAATPSALAAPPISGIGLDSIKGGDIQLRLPMTQGTHKVDFGRDEAAEFEVSSGTEMRLSSKVGTGPDGPRLDGVSVQFSKPLVLKNPSALTSIPLGDLADMVVDVHINGFTVGADGKLTPQGRIKGFLIDKPLTDFIKPADLPKLDLDLKDILAGNMMPPGGGKGGAIDFSKLKASDLMRQFGPMVGKGDYNVRLDGEQSSITVGDKALTIEGKGPKDAHVQLTGSLDLDNRGHFLFTNSTNVNSQLANISAQVSGDFGLDGQDKPQVTASLKSSVDLKDVDVTQGQNHIAVQGAHSSQEIQAEATINMQGGQINVQNGKTTLDIQGSAAIEQKTAQGGLKGNVDVQLKGQAAISGTAQNLQANASFEAKPIGGTATVSAGGMEIPVSVQGEGSVIAGNMKVQVQGNRVTINDGSASLRLAVDAKAPSVEVMGGKLTFDGKALVTGNSKLGYSPETGFVLDDGKVNLQAALKEGQLKAKGLDVHLAEGSSISADIQSLHYGPDGLKLSNPRLGFDFLLPSSQFEMGGIKLALDGTKPSRLTGSTPIQLDGTKPSIPTSGDASVQFQLYGKSIGGTFPGGSFESGKGAQEFKGDAKIRFSPKQIDILEGHLDAHVDLGGSTIHQDQLGSAQLAGNAALEAIARGGKPLGRGASGASVKKVQEALVAAGIQVGTDGAFGPKTETAIRGYQQQRGLTPTGKIDAALLQALDQALRANRA